MSSDPAAPTVSYHTRAADATVEAPGGGAAGSAARDAIDAPPDLHERVLGDFALAEVIGQGGCGTAYRAEQRALGRPAVVKVIHRSLSARRDVAQRFAREARLASRFDHPHAAHIYSFGVEHDGVMWIAMELVDGTPLAQLIRGSGPLALDRFVPLFEQLCEVVQSAHDQGIVHRDIKPSNIMVIERAGRIMPKLLDFGIAKLVAGNAGPTSAAATQRWREPGDPASGRARELTQDGQVLGSPMYMAPEQWRDATSAGPPADQYALALVAYEALTGARAFEAPTLAALEDQHQHAALPALPTHLPAALHAVLARASEKLPERRFPSLTELAAAVRRAARDATDELTATVGDAPDDIAPYPGLAAYTATGRAWFVGRERDTAELIDRLGTQPIVTVIGPSGSGKTSFLAAGLAPSLPPSWHAELIRPGDDPPGALAAIIKPRHAPPYRETPHDDTALPPEAASAGLIGLAEARQAVLVVIVDQAEELFTMCDDDARRAAFAEALVAASASPRVRVVLALRDDFLCRIEQLAAWRGLLGRTIHVLGNPGRDDLERMVTVPARGLGFEFDDPALPREIVDHVAGRPGALPLVAFTAAQLWERRDRVARRLTRDAYRRIGGVVGALVQHADSIVDRMSIPERRQVRSIFGRLLSSEGARALIGRAELESALGGRAVAAVLDRLLAARLVVSRDDDTGDRIEIIHETLATTWPRLAAWRRDDAERARLVERLAAAARHWDERARPEALLWRGEAVADLRRWRSDGGDGMTPVERAFAQASIAAATRGRRARIAAVAAGFAVLVAGIVALASANREITGQRTAAIDRLRASFEERGRLAIADGEDAHGMLYLAEAARLGDRGPSFDLLASYAAASLDARLGVLGHVSAGITAVEISPTAVVTLGSDRVLWRWDRAGGSVRVADGIYYATLVGDLAVSISTRGDILATDLHGATRWRAERAVLDPGMRPAGILGSASAHLVAAFSDRVTLWDLDTGHLRGELAHEQGVTAIALDAEGAQLATGDPSGVVRIWDTARRTLIATCAPHAGDVRALRFAPDRRTVVSGGNDGEVRICDAASGATLHRMIGHSHQVLTLDIAADGHTIVSGGRDGKPRLWDARSGLLIRVLEGHRGTVTVARFAPDGRELLTLGDDGTARIWDRDGTPLGSLQGHGGPIYAGRWDADGHHVITASTDGAIRWWDPARAIKTAFRHEHQGEIAALALSGDDRRLITAGSDRRAVVWDLRALQPIAELPHRGAVLSVELSPDGASALTTDDGGNARLWQLPAGAPIAALGAGVTAEALAPDGQAITAGGGVVRFWTSRGVELGAVEVGYEVRRLVLDPTGHWLFVTGQTSAVAVIDVAAHAAVAHLAIQDSLVRGAAADGSRVAITDGVVVRLWQLGTWSPRATLVGHRTPVTDVWFLADGRLVTAASDATLAWGRDARLSSKLTTTGMTFALAASPDGAVFATLGSDGAIRVWDAATTHLLLQLPAHRLPALALRFTHDGTAVISGGNDGRLVTWDLTRRTYLPSELAEIVRCRVPLRLEGDVALPRDLDFDDPTCRSLPRGRGAPDLP
ncbi:MAG TPA: protein kinase [Kofleriaceae bacterium]|nr:protein kinase [Kofleriaceae bacterium]